MRRLLCLISGMNAGGAETFLMKIYRQMDKSKYQMDFCINITEKCFYEDEILSMGGKIYRIPAKSENRKEFARQLTQVVQQGKYTNVLRITSSAMGFMDLKIAKRAGADICIARSSNSSDGIGWKIKFIHQLGQLLYGKNVDVRIAPSDLAAEYTFGRKAYAQGKVTILSNGVDLHVFRFDENGRKTVRREFDLKDKLVVGHIGRFNQQKNHAFLLDIFYEIQKKKENAVLLLVGKGELENDIKEKINRLGIKEKVVFTGVRSDVPGLLSAMDVFVFPSFFEGMPNTVIEAQATGLPCVIADTITKTADITGLVEYLPLESSSTQWAECALEKVTSERKNTTQAFIDRGYDIESVTRQFLKLCFGQQTNGEYYET